VKIIDIDLDRRRISLSIKQAAEGGVVAAEYQDQFGEHAYDEAGNYIGPEIVVDEPEAAEGTVAEVSEGASEAPVVEAPDLVAESTTAPEPVENALEAPISGETPVSGGTTAE
jgi:small subunit ribosomal protein S1